MPSYLTMSACHTESHLVKSRTMRMVKPIMTTLFALQLFTAAAFRVDLCCASSSSVTPRAGRSETESKALADKSPEAAGHCHSKPSVKPKQGSSQKAANLTSSRRDCHGARSVASANRHLCACGVEREERSGRLLSANQAEASSPNRDLQKTEASPKWVIEASPPAILLPHHPQSHSPPHTGFQISLRI